MKRSRGLRDSRVSVSLPGLGVFVLQLRRVDEDALLLAFNEVNEAVPFGGREIDPSRTGLNLLVFRGGCHRGWVSLFRQRVNLRHDSGNTVLQGHALLGRQDWRGTQYLKASHGIFHFTGFVIRNRLLHLLTRRGAGRSEARPGVGRGWRRFGGGHRGGRFFQLVYGVLFMTRAQDCRDGSQQRAIDGSLFQGSTGAQQ